MVAASNAQAVAYRSTPEGSLEYSGHAPAIQPPRLRTQPGFDIAQPLSAGPLGKRHGEDLAEVH
jgi:hypothetical protein